MAKSLAEPIHTEAHADPVWRILTGVLAFSAGVVICGSVGSYSPTDPSWNTAGQASVENLFGTGGAILADWLRQALGWSAWVAGFALMMGGATRSILIGTPRLYRWMLGGLFIPLSAGFFAAWPMPASWPLRAGLGGLVGDRLHDLALLPFKALMLPAPGLFSGLFMGALALLCLNSALGLRRSQTFHVFTTAMHSFQRTFHAAFRWLPGLHRAHSRQTGL